jgi:6-pyruvoyltetrahydropterin/6-carboxytetrahydropterin synthase
MGILIRRSYDLEVAHRLTAGVPEGHKCRRPHGHRYQLTIYVEGLLGPAPGMLIEYGDLDRVVVPVLKLLDHHDANTLAERCSTAEATWVSENPTVEMLALWLAARLERLVGSAAVGKTLKLARIELQEDARAGAVWTP